MTLSFQNHDYDDVDVDCAVHRYIFLDYDTLFNRTEILSLIFQHSIHPFLKRQMKGKQRDQRLFIVITRSEYPSTVW